MRVLGFARNGGVVFVRRRQQPHGVDRERLEGLVFDDSRMFLEYGDQVSDMADATFDRLIVDLSPAEEAELGRRDAVAVKIEKAEAEGPPQRRGGRWPAGT